MTASRAGSKRKPEVSSGDWHLRSLALAAGAITGIIGTAFKFGITSGYSLYVRLLTLGNRGSFRGWLLAALSGAAIVAAAAFLTQRFAPEAAGSGIQEIEGTLAGVRPRLRWVEVILVKFFGGLLAMSSGLVLGREGPTVAIGACVGAALARFRPDTKDRNEANTLVSSGSAAGLAVAFNAPVGGILFVLEETRREFPVDLRSAQCVILATVAAIIVNLLISGYVRILPTPIYQSPTLVELVLVLPFAVLAGAYGAFLNAALLRTLKLVRALKLQIGWLTVAFLIGGAIGTLVWCFVDATGEGGDLTVRLLQGPQTLELLVLLILVRTVVFTISYSSGTPGGIFTPLLAFGAIGGLLFAGCVELLVPGLKLDPGKFAVAGMAALLTATVRAPLTSLALVVEMTGDFQLLLMSLIASIVADVAASALGGRPIYEQLLDRTLRLGRPR